MKFKFFFPLPIQVHEPPEIYTRPPCWGVGGLGVRGLRFKNRSCNVIDMSGNCIILCI